MKTFLKIFATVLVAQILFIVQMFLTGIGDGVVLYAYGMPYMVLDSLVELPDQIGGESSLAAFVLLCLPAILYALLIAGGLTLIYRLIGRL
jgi:hypothetical protein